MPDDGGVLGNLPNSRPGKRSTKRDPGAGRPAKAAEAAAAKAEAGGKQAAKPPRTSKAARTSAKPGRAAAGAGAKPKRAGASGAARGAGASGAARGAGASGAARTGGAPADTAARARTGAERRRSTAPITPGASPDPLTGAIRTAAGIAVTGARVAGALTNELLRRLPRP